MLLVLQLVAIVSSNKQMELLARLLETNTKSGRLLEERLVGIVLGGQTLARYPLQENNTS